MKNTKSPRKKSAFTLIEMMFIVVIIGLVIALSLATFQQRASNTRIDKTALQMAQLLQAANTYFVSWGCWPESSSCPPNAADFSFYLPVGNKNNPWGKSYTYKVDPNNPDNFLISSGNLASAEAASRVASVLPNASIDTSDNEQVIVAAGGGAQGESIMFQYFLPAPLLTNGSNQAVIFECPKGWSGSAAGIPIAINATPQVCMWSPLLVPSVSILTPGSDLISNLQLYFTGPCTKTSGPIEDSFTCNGVLAYTSNAQQVPPFCIPKTGQLGGSTTIMEIGYCLPP